MRRGQSVVAVNAAEASAIARSNPATYTALFTFIRELFAMVPEAPAAVQAGRAADVAALKKITIQGQPPAK